METVLEASDEEAGCVGGLRRRRRRPGARQRRGDLVNWQRCGDLGGQRRLSRSLGVDEDVETGRGDGGEDLQAGHTCFKQRKRLVNPRRQKQSLQDTRRLEQGRRDPRRLKQSRWDPMS
ncbi:hypothetical protein ATANTOWER_021354 [Ataeniobius toweri]|uniref:Uncharacterized protein n=1 Tax=Ataeniobius toweri TaxID=208326 RepID=A0ABU7AIF9_9TELE|nr:hypothetical protein [Ataeniobius toweri]